MRYLLLALFSPFAVAAPLCTEVGPDSPGTIESIAFSPDGRTIATTAKAETRVGRWRFDAAAGKVVAD